MDEIKHREQVDLIREVFYYQSRFDGKTIVLKIDYPILNAPHFPQLLKDMAMLRATGIEIILVPGSREWIDAVLEESCLCGCFSKPPDMGAASCDHRRKSVAPRIRS